LISIIVSTFNAAATLQRCIDSIARQTHAAAELLVVDGGSSDGTVDIIERNAARVAWWLSEPDRGIYHAWNKGVERARGDWICFLGADDYLWRPDVLGRLSPILASAYPRFRVVYGEIAMVNAAGQEVLRVAQPWPAARARFRHIMSIPHPGLMHHRSLFAERGLFDESFKIAGDYELLLRELSRNDALFVPGLVVAGMTHGGVSATPAGRLASTRECRRAQRKNGASRPGLLWMWEMAKAQVRYALWRMLGEKRAASVFDILRAVSGKPRYWTKQ
jgi:glycosyltransferase involved in cell wall biosynthesis